MVVRVIPEITNSQKQSNREDNPERSCCCAKSFLHTRICRYLMHGNLQLGRNPANSRCIGRRPQSFSLGLELAILFTIAARLALLPRPLTARQLERNHFHAKEEDRNQ